MDCWKKKNKKGSGCPDLSGLETELEYEERWRSIRVIYFTMFLMSLGFGIVLTGVWPYLDKLDPSAGKEFMGYVVGANPLGQFLLSPLVGWWANKCGSIRQPLLFTTALFTISSIGYSSLEVLPQASRKYFMLASRFMVGVSSANIAACRSYLSAATRVKERTGAVSIVSLMQVLGFIVGPGVQAAVTILGAHGVPLFGDLRLDMFTAGSWINVILGVVNFIMFLPFVFKERRIAAREAMVGQGAISEDATWKQTKPDYFSLWTLNMAFYVLLFNFVLLETLATPLTMDQFAWSDKQALFFMGILMCVGGIVACTTFMAIGPLCKRFDEHRVLIWGGFFLMVIGRAAYLPWNWNAPPPQIAMSIVDARNMTEGNSTEVLGCPASQEWCATTPGMTVFQFVLGFLITSIGYPIGVTLIQTLYSKLLGPRPQGVWMGVLTSAGCLSRFMGPVFVSYVYTRFGTVWTFSLTTAIMAIWMSWLMFFRNRLVTSVKEANKGLVADPRKADSEKANGIQDEADIPLQAVT